jgi:hypothetical protein
VRGYGVRLLQWLGERDRGFTALRRAGRTAIVMPATLAVGEELIANPTVATFAAFGSFSMLLLVGFSGPMADRLKAQLALGLLGGVFVALGTLASASWWLAALSMTCVAFVVLFLGVVSSQLASAPPGLLLAFILPVSLGGSAARIPDRLAGWGLTTAAAVLAVAWLWPAPTREPLRGPATAARRAFAARLRSDAGYMLGEPGAPMEAEQRRVIAAEQAAVAGLHAVFLATPYRPTGLSTATRTVVRLVDELEWLSLVLQCGHRPKPASLAETTRL